MEHENTPNEPQKEYIKKTSISTPAAIITGAVIIGLAVIFIGQPKAAKQQPAADAPAGEVTSVPADVATVRPTDHIRGNTNADVVIVEYSDSDCPFCVRFHTTMQTIVDEYKGKVAWVYRYFPLDSLHPNATTEAVAMECVADLGGNDAFNKYLDTIINVTLNADPKSNQTLTTFATAQGVDGKLFQNCIKDTKASDRVQADALEAQKIGARGTPFSIAYNQKTGEQVVIPGAYPIEEVRTMIDGLLK